MSAGAEPGVRAGFSLPATWDPERDLLVWIGRAGPALPRGARVFVLATDEREAVPTGVKRVRTRDELFRAVLDFRGALPAHALVHRSPEASPALQRETAAVLQDALRAKILQQRTVALNGTTWLLQGLGNLPSLAQHPSIEPLRGVLAGEPCVLVSPGPSLSRNVAELRELAARALIVSGTHALSALARADVAPHLVVCADPGDLSRHLEGLDLGAIEAFVIGATCRAETLALAARRVFTFASNGPLDEWLFGPLGEAPWLATGGSVACSMLSLALHLGCDPIAFVGQDLSFDERFYAAEGLDGDATVAPAGAGEFVLIKPSGATGIGTPLADGRLQFTVPQRIVEVPGWAGGRVRSTPQLKAFLDWFEHVAPALVGRTRLLNCTEGGARIAGMEHLPLRTASADWRRRRSPAEALDAARASLDPTARRQRLHEWARSSLRALDGCTALARSCRVASEARAPDLEALARLERKLSGALRGATLVSLVAQDEIARSQEQARRATSLEQNLAAARGLYDVVLRAGELLGEPLRAAARALS